jgi:acyl-CoA dehydrogenase
MQILNNLPNRATAWIAQLIILPFGVCCHGPSDRLRQRCADLLTEPSDARDRLTVGLFLGQGDDGIAQLEKAFALVTGAEDIMQKLRHAGVHDWHAAKEGLLTEGERERLSEMERAVTAVVDVDDFAPDELAPRDESSHDEHRS